MTHGATSPAPQSWDSEGVTGTSLPPEGFRLRETWQHVDVRAVLQVLRGQLAAYLRALGSKVPNIYGPSADAEP